MGFPWCFLWAIGDGLIQTDSNHQSPSGSFEDMDIDMALSEKSVSHIPMDYHHVPH
jgi:hypothetical protein